MSLERSQKDRGTAYVVSSLTGSILFQLKIQSFVPFNNYPDVKSIIASNQILSNLYY